MTSRSVFNSAWVRYPFCRAAALMTIGRAASSAQAQDRRDDLRLPQQGQVGAFAAVKHLAKAHTDPGEDNRARNDAQHGGPGEVEEPHADQRGQQVGHEERHGRHKAQQQQHADLMFAQAVLDLLRACRPRRPSCAASDLPRPARAAIEDRDGAQRGGNDVESCAKHKAKQKPAGDRRDRRTGQGKRHDDDIDPDEGRHEAKVIGIAEGQQSLTIFAQRVKAEVIAQGERSDHCSQQNHGQWQHGAAVRAWVGAWHHPCFYPV